MLLSQAKPINKLWMILKSLRRSFLEMIERHKMNANELADKLSQYGEGAIFASIKLTDVATMLRQQQAEIDALKELLNEFGITVKRRTQDK